MVLSTTISEKWLGHYSLTPISYPNNQNKQKLTKLPLKMIRNGKNSANNLIKTAAKSKKISTDRSTLMIFANAGIK